MEHDTYPPPPLHAFVGQFLSYGFMVCILLTIGLGNFVLTADMTAWVNNNKTMIVGVGFVCNIIGSQLLQTGAFEIYLDETLVHSKLKSGGLIKIENLINDIGNRIKQ